MEDTQFYRPVTIEQAFDDELVLPEFSSSSMVVLVLGLIESMIISMSPV